MYAAHAGGPPHHACHHASSTASPHPVGHEAGLLTVTIGERALSHVGHILAAREDFDARASAEPKPVT